MSERQGEDWSVEEVAGAGGTARAAREYHGRAVCECGCKGADPLCCNIAAETTYPMCTQSPAQHTAQQVGARGGGCVCVCGAPLFCGGPATHTSSSPPPLPQTYGRPPPQPSAQRQVSTSSPATGTADTRILLHLPLPPALLTSSSRRPLLATSDTSWSSALRPLVKFSLLITLTEEQVVIVSHFH